MTVIHSACGTHTFAPTAALAATNNAQLLGAQRRWRATRSLKFAVTTNIIWLGFDYGKLNALGYYTIWGWRRGISMEALTLALLRSPRGPGYDVRREFD